MLSTHPSFSSSPYLPSIKSEGRKRNYLWNFLIYSFEIFNVKIFSLMKDRYIDAVPRDSSTVLYVAGLGSH